MSGREAEGKLRLNVTTSPTLNLMPILRHEFSARVIHSQISEIKTLRHLSHDLICSGDAVNAAEETRQTLRFWRAVLLSKVGIRGVTELWFPKSGIWRVRGSRKITELPT
jgi:hypothetical protein